ncbi:extracellular solute-binding protein [Bradyrhizobium manausense]|uniref:extracellular solute-binding protein n=1 Tax=Bradyrhizobium manausense TaxID=989370 RepID=UPI001BA88BD1|nr:extracellular solute-binding protein [Bradyrhizobium manausense]MBR0725511.1 extracellular solute-binding protein [Bradyrhizobium manausense]
MKAGSISRRAALTSLASAAAMVGPLGRLQAQETKLSVSWYPGLLGANFRRSFLDTFADKDRVVVTESFDSPRFTQMQASRAKPNTDVAAFIDVLMPLVARSGLVSKLDAARIPNLANVDPALMTWDGFAVPAAYGSWGIVYNAKWVSKPIVSWGDLLRDDLKGHVTHPNVTYNSSIYSLDAFARLGNGDLRSPEAGMKSIRQIRLSGPGLWEQDSIAVGWLKTEEIWATPYFSGSVLALMQDKDVPDLRFVVPSEGAYAVPLNVAKVANAPNGALADGFIDHILGEAAQNAWTINGRTRPANRNVAVSAEIAASVPEIGKLRRIDWDYFSQNRAALVASWNDIVNR